MAAFLVFALPMTWLAWAEPAWAERWRLQKRKPDVVRWWWPSVGRWLVNNAILAALLVLAWPVVRGMVTLRVDGWPAWWEVLGSVVVFAYLDDVLYYFLHRAFHHASVYRHVHVVHHRVVTPSAITGHYMHPVEFVATGLLMLVGPLLLGSHILTTYVWIVVRQWEAAEGHCGYRLPVGLLHGLPGSGGAAPHDLHHARVRGNYSGFLGWFDKVMGTALTPDADRR